MHYRNYSRIAATQRHRFHKRGVTGSANTLDEFDVRLVLAGGVCVYCGRERHLEVDHVTAAGPNTVGNCVPACRSCNARKGARLPHEVGMPIRYTGAQYRLPL